MFNRAIRNKKAVEGLMWIIIVIVIGLVVAAVLITVFSGKIKLTSKVNACVENGGSCMTASSCQEKVNAGTHSRAFHLSCTNKDQVCCLPE